MTFTGTLIEDLMATVERAEQRAALSPCWTGETADAPLSAEPLLDGWLASALSEFEGCGRDAGATIGECDSVMGVAS